MKNERRYKRLCTPDDIYQRIKNYKRESEENNVRCSGIRVDNTLVGLRFHKDDEQDTTYYIMSNKGICNHYDMKGNIIEKGILKEELSGSKFELFNPIQIFKSAYISISNIEELINASSIQKYLENVPQMRIQILMKMIYERLTKEKNPAIQPLSIKYWKEFSNHGKLPVSISFKVPKYQSVVQIVTIMEMLEINRSRSFYGLRLIPFKRDNNWTNQFYIMAYTNYGLNQPYQKTENAIQDVLVYLRNRGCDITVRDTNIRYPVYV